MEGPGQDPCRDRGNELRIETSSRHRQTSSASASKVCFAVVCKLIACNIKRWAKAHLSLKRILQGCLASFCVCVKLWSDLVAVTLCKKQISRGSEHHRDDNLIVSETALTSQGSKSEERPLRLVSMAEGNPYLKPFPRQMLVFLLRIRALRNELTGACEQGNNRNTEFWAGEHEQGSGTRKERPTVYMDRGSSER